MHLLVADREQTLLDSLRVRTPPQLPHTFMLDRLERQVIFDDGAIVDLTLSECRLLSYLIKHAGRIVTTTELCAELWNSDEDGNSGTNLVIVNLLRLRRKLERNAGQPPILTILPSAACRFELRRKTDLIL